ncbi:MAG TPA: excinuclease ABC subunit A, partial [Methylomirabilota bacterium]|nr:excinuclease ABC subunit A [Methylomirabilota bacterium]
MPKTSALPAIRLRGVRHNNLKGFDLDLPLNRLIVITGLSGSGKSSLAFDTLFAEGQRRYIETFSPYARQFFDRMDKPRVDSIEGIPPAIAIEQRNTVKSTRSTVGTMTEVCDHMKLLWPELAVLHCRQCGRPVRKETPRQVWETVTKSRGEAGVAGLGKRQEERELVLHEALDWPSGPEVLITFDLPLSDKLGLEESLALIARQGYQRLMWEGEPLRVDEAGARLAGSAPTHLRIIQDRLRPAPEQRARFIEACEQAYHFGKGALTVHAVEGPPFRITDSRRFSNRFHCASCDVDYREPTPALFSFNHPLGACPACRGFGRIIHIDYDLAIPDRGRTLAGGAVKPWQTGLSRECQTDLMKFCRKRGVATDVPFQDLPVKWQEWVIQGDADYGKDAAHEWPKAWYGVRGYFRSLESKSYKMHVRVLLSRYRAYRECPDCGGRRFQPDALLFRVAEPPGNGRKPV